MMRKFLSHDTTTGQLRLVYTDLWNGQHERTEYRVMTDRVRGYAVRNRPDLDGRAVSGVAPDLYLPGPLGGRTHIWTEPTAIGPTVKVPCPRAVNARRKCALCASELAA